MREESVSLHKPLLSSRRMEWMMSGSSLWQQSARTWRRMEEIRHGQSYDSKPRHKHTNSQIL